jgi:hypothetical protein
MSFFLLIVTFFINGQQGVSVTRVETQGECFRAMQAVVKAMPQATVECEAVQRGE